MKAIHIILVALAGAACLSGCRPDQEYRLAEACRESVTYIVAPDDKGLEKSCSCYAKAAVAQLDQNTIEAMIRMFEGEQTLLASNATDDMATFAKIANFQMANANCLEPLGGGL